MVKKQGIASVERVSEVWEAGNLFVVAEGFTKQNTPCNMDLTELKRMSVFIVN